MLAKKKTVILVHPSMSVPVLFCLLKQKHLKIFSIISQFESSHLDRGYITNQSDFYFVGTDEVSKDYPKIDAIVKENSLDIVGVINGIDATLAYTDRIISQYLDPLLDIKSSEVRLNKNAVNNLLAKNNISFICGKEVTGQDNLQKKIAEFSQWDFPLIAKPSENTAAMAAVKVLHNTFDLSNYFSQYFGKKNDYYGSQVVDKVLVQKYISHKIYREFALDFVSINGKHECLSILEYRLEWKDGEHAIRRQNIPYNLQDNPELEVIVEYVLSCLNILGVRHGHTHNEVLWDGKEKLFLVESNSRVGGSGMMELALAYYGTSPYHYYISRVCLGETVAQSSIHKRSKKIAVLVDLYNFSVDCAKKINLQGLKSDCEIIHFRNRKINARNFYIEYNRLKNINARVLLSSESENSVKSDIETLIYREGKGELFS